MNPRPTRTETTRTTRRCRRSPVRYVEIEPVALPGKRHRCRADHILLIKNAILAACPEKHAGKSHSNRKKRLESAKLDDP
jgi:hypothetical protein